MRSKSSFFIFFTLFFTALFLYFKIPTVLKLSFFVNFLILWGITYYSIFLEKKFSPFLSVFVVFNLLFFIVAPIIQIDYIVKDSLEGGRFIQKFPFTETTCLRANAYLFIFNLIFFISYVKINNNLRVKPIEVPIEKVSKYKNIPVVLMALALLTIAIIVINFSTILFQFQNEFYKEVEATTTSKYLIVQKFLFFIPISGVVLAYCYLKKGKTKTANYYFVVLYLIFFIAIVFFLKNPLTEKRNALGPIYITLIFLFFKKILDTNFKTMRFVFLSMILLFPVLTILTHSRYSLSQMIAKPNVLVTNFEYLHVTDAFNSLHYDAYPNFLATIDYFDKKEVVYGEPLLGSLLFFVPRSIWHSKPETTGFKIGNYLVEKYKFNFNNLSNPYISESYLNFGFLGILIYPVVLALIFRKMIIWLKGNDILKSIFAFYVAIYLMYFLRGDFTNGFAYLVATYLAIVFVPKAIHSILATYVRYK